MFFLVGALLRLLVGPVSLGPFNGPLADAIQKALPGITLKYDQPALEWNRDEGKVSLVILGARMFDANGRIVAQAPKVDIDLAAAPLIHGDFVVQRITLVGVQLTLVHMQDGSIRLGVEKDKASGDIISRLNDIITAGNSSTSSLKSFAIRNARGAFQDEGTGLFVVVSRAGLSLETKGKDLHTLLDADIEISGHSSHIKAEFTFPPGNGTASGTASMEGLDLRALAANSKSFESLSDLALVGDFTSSFQIAPGGHIAGADFSMKAKGSIPIAGLKSGVLKVQSLDAAGRYDGDAHLLRIDSATLEADKTSGRLKGRIEFVHDSAGTLQKLDADISADHIVLNMPGVLANSTSLSGGQLKASWLPASRDLAVENFSLSDGPLSFGASGKVTFPDGQTPVIALKGQLAALPVRDLVHYWPINWAPGVREWIDANVKSGRIGPLAFETQIAAGALDAPVLPENAVHLTFGMSNAEMIYVRGLTTMTEVTGNALMTGDTFSARIDSARIGPLTLSQGKIDIAQLHVDGTPAIITAHADGSLPDVLRLIDMKPLGYPTKFKITPAETTGTASVDVNFKVPTLRVLPIDAIGIGVRANVTGMAIVLGRAHFTDGNILFVVDDAKLHATGNTALAGSRLNIDWTEDFHPKDTISTRVHAVGALNDAARDMLGIKLDEILVGPATVDANLAGSSGSLRTIDMTMNLAQARLAQDMLGIDKPAGSAMTASANVLFTPDTGRVQSVALRLTGPNGGSNGNITLNPDGTLANIAFQALRVGATDIALNLTETAAGLTDVMIRGRQLDGTRLAARGSNESSVAKIDPAAVSSGKLKEPSFNGPFHVNARVDRYVLREGVVVAPFALDISGIDNRPSALTLTGSLGRNTLNASLTQTPQGRRISVTSNDAGTLVKGLIGFTSLRGGDLDVSVLLPGKATDAPSADPKVPDFTGTLNMKGIAVLNQPFLARFFTVGSLTGFGNLMQNNGIQVDQLNVPFSSKNGVISVNGVRATGPAIGLTAEGWIDRPKNVIALKGSLVPIFGLNGIINNIPLIGDVLGGKKGEGIFAFTYSATGNADEPDVSVNPLSALAPGFLRQLFQGKMPDAANAPSNAPAPSAPEATPPAPAPATSAPATAAPAP